MATNFEYLLRLFEACIVNDITAFEYLYALGFNRNSTMLPDAIPSDNGILDQLIDALDVFKYSVAIKGVKFDTLKDDELIVSLIGSPAVMINSLLRVRDMPDMPVLLNDSRNDNVRKVFANFQTSGAYAVTDTHGISRKRLFDRLREPMDFVEHNKEYVANYDPSDYKKQKKMVRLLFAVHLFNGTSDAGKYLHSMFFGTA
jgi:hypothetical protein